MENKQFDEHIKRQLENFQVDHQENHWEQMDQRLDIEFGLIPEIEDQVIFDTDVQQKLGSHQVSYNPLHWILFKKRLELEDERVRNVFVSKLFELTLFLLLAIFFYQINEGEAPIYRSPFLVPGQAIDMASESGIPSFPELYRESQTDPARGIPNQVVNRSSTNRKNDSQATIALATNVSQTTKRITSPAALDKSQLIAMLVSINPPSVLLKKPGPAFTDLSQVHREMPILAFLHPAELKAGDRQLDIPEVHVHNHPIQWFNLSASRDANLLNESVLAALNPDSLLGSYGVGLMAGLSIQNNHWEFETGLSYSNKKIPINQTQIAGDTKAYVKSSVIDSRLHLAQLPVHAKYHFRPESTIGFYVGTGINLNFLMHSKELVTDQNLDFPLPGGFVSVPSSNKSFVAELSHAGLLEGGEIEDNIYITLSVMMGLQARINSGMSVFLQPAYQHHVFSQKLGPKDDKIHVLSLQLGSKFKF